MPKPKKTPNFNDLTVEEKEELLNENAERRAEKDLELVKKTRSAQAGVMDKMMLTCAHYIRTYGLQDNTLTDEDLYQLGLPASEDEKKLNSTLSADMIKAVIKEPYKLEQFREYLNQYGVLEAWNTHEIGKLNAHYMAEADKIMKAHEKNNQIPEDVRNNKINGRTLTEQLGDWLTMQTQSMPVQLSRAVPDVYADLGRHDAPGFQGRNGDDYRTCMTVMLMQDLENKLQPKDHPNMTVEEFIRLVNMSDEDKKKLLEGNDLKLQDNLYEKIKGKLHKEKRMGLGPLQDKIKAASTKTQKLKEELDKLEAGSEAYQQKEAALKTAQEAQKQAENKYQSALHEGTITTLQTMYSTQMPKGWIREGRLAYEKGLMESERKELQNGDRLLAQQNHGRQAIRKNLENAKINLDQVTDPMIHENILACAAEVDEKLRSGKALMTRTLPGISAAVKIPTPELRGFLMSGIIHSLEDNGSTWTGHKKNSKTYEKMLSSVKDYKEALETGEGGKAWELRKTMLNNCLAYVKDKGRVRRETHGQNRFDDVMTILANELSPSKFQLVCDELNKNRGKDEKLKINDYDEYTKRLISGERDKERKAQERYDNPVSSFAKDHPNAINSMMDNYGPAPGDDDYFQYKAVGKKGALGEDATLSNRDFAALTFGSSLSVQAGNHGADRQLLNPDAEAVRQGKAVTRAALNAYAGGNKEPLARLIVQCLENVKTAGAEQRSPEEKTCLDEASIRFREMAVRDPELQKLAVRSGLQPAPEANQIAQPARQMNQPEAGPQIQN